MHCGKYQTFAFLTVICRCYLVLIMLYLEATIGVNLPWLCQASRPAGATDNAYVFDDDLLCDEFDFINNLTDNDDSLASEGTRYAHLAHNFF